LLRLILSVFGDARDQLHMQMFGIRSLVQDSDQLSDGLILQMALVIAVVVRREDEREIAIRLQKETRWRTVIAVLHVTILKQLAPYVAERESSQRSYHRLPAFPGPSDDVVQVPPIGNCRALTYSGAEAQLKP
jgi:hypothetical protein